MAFKLKIDRGLSSEKIEDTNHNVVIKFDSRSVKRMHGLSLEEAREIYINLLQNLTTPSSQTK